MVVTEWSVSSNRVRHAHQNSLLGIGFGISSRHGASTELTNVVSLGPQESAWIPLLQPRWPSNRTWWNRDKKDVNSTTYLPQTTHLHRPAAVAVQKKNLVKHRLVVHCFSHAQVSEIRNHRQHRQTTNMKLQQTTTRGNSHI